MTDNIPIKYANALNNPGLETLLKNWIRLIEEYSKVHDGGDACYWYNERATLSILAAAAWKTTGWCALEEYLTTKRNPDNPDYTGRCDLYIASKEIGYECEAKQSWQKYEEQEFTDLKNKIIAAIGATKSLIPIKGYERLALTFCVPSSKDKFDETKIKEWLRNLMKLSEFKKSIAQSWVFPESCRDLQSEINKRIFPGVVLLAHKVQ